MKPGWTEEAEAYDGPLLGYKKNRQVVVALTVIGVIGIVAHSLWAIHQAKTVGYHPEPNRSVAEKFVVQDDTKRVEDLKEGESAWVRAHSISLNESREPYIDKYSMSIKQQVPSALFVYVKDGKLEAVVPRDLLLDNPSAYRWKIEPEDDYDTPITIHFLNFDVATLQQMIDEGLTPEEIKRSHDVQYASNRNDHP